MFSCARWMASGSQFNMTYLLFCSIDRDNVVFSIRFSTDWTSCQRAVASYAGQSLVRKYVAASLQSGEGILGAWESCDRADIWRGGIGSA